MFLAMVAVGCSGRYVGQPREAILSLQTEPTYGHLYELSVAYGEALNAAVKADTLHPGMYADYGVTLALMGHRGEACRMLNAEARAFPSSARIVHLLKQRLIPEMLADTFCAARDTANLAQLMGWGYDSLASLVPIHNLPPVIDSSDTARIRMQTPVDSVVYPIRLTATQKREMLFEEQAKEARMKQAMADSVAAAKQAKIDARKQAKKEHRQAAKEKKRQAKQREKEREKARKQKAAERKAQSKQKAANSNNNNTPTQP